MKHSRFVALLLISALSACSIPKTNGRDYCASNQLLVEAHFEGGQMGRCAVNSDGSFELTLYPEDQPPINVSPWYAFRVSGKPGERAHLQLVFEDGYSRYWPKISIDGKNWQSLGKESVRRSADGTRMDLEFELEQAQLWVAGQELTVSTYYDQWFDELASHDEVDVALAGRSVQGRPIYLAETPARSEMVILLGRQHPPEVTGAFAMRPFVRTVLSDSALAQQFRARFQLVIMPFINPDGVAAGHWRHNMNGVDLNRDWGPFTQPETRIMRDWLETAEATGRKPVLMLDFHSTQKNVFYTQRDEDPTQFSGFTAHWMQAVSEHMPGYEFVREANETSDQPNSKNYFYLQYGIPAMTYETGDETSRAEIEDAAVVFAEEMMRLLLGFPAGDNH